jgi:hypothetical protein
MPLYTTQNGSVTYTEQTFPSIYLIIPAALEPGVYSASNTNEYKKQKNNHVSGEYSAAGT